MKRLTRFSSSLDIGSATPPGFDISNAECGDTDILVGCIDVQTAKNRRGGRRTLVGHTPPGGNIGGWILFPSLELYAVFYL